MLADEDKETKVNIIFCEPNLFVRAGRVYWRLRTSRRSSDVRLKLPIKKIIGNKASLVLSLVAECTYP